MSNISTTLEFVTVARRPGNSAQGLLRAGGRVFPCALGKGGITILKREGDGATPRASMRVLSALCRPELPAPPAARIPLRRIRPDDGWCDAPWSASYNRPVRLPFRASHERMWRADHLYDRVVVLDWNITSRRQLRGSAIFMHIAKSGYQPTEGCIAISRQAMDWLLPRLSRRTRIRVL